MTRELTKDELYAIWSVHPAVPDESIFHEFVELARTIIKADRALRVPMTDDQINDSYGAARVQFDHIPHDDVVRIVRAAERHHGIKT